MTVARWKPALAALDTLSGRLSSSVENTPSPPTCFLYALHGDNDAVRVLWRRRENRPEIKGIDKKGEARQKKHRKEKKKGRKELRE